MSFQRRKDLIFGYIRDAGERSQSSCPIPQSLQRLIFDFHSAVDWVNKLVTLQVNGNRNGWKVSNRDFFLSVGEPRNDRPLPTHPVERVYCGKMPSFSAFTVAAKASQWEKVEWRIQRTRNEEEFTLRVESCDFNKDQDTAKGRYLRASRWSSESAVLVENIANATTFHLEFVDDSVTDCVYIRDLDDRGYVDNNGSPSVVMNCDSRSGTKWKISVSVPPDSSWTDCLEVDSRIDLYDRQSPFVNSWVDARVLEIGSGDTEGEIFVLDENRGHRQWLSMESVLIAPHRSQSTRFYDYGDRFDDDDGWQCGCELCTGYLNEDEFVFFCIDDRPFCKSADKYRRSRVSRAKQQKRQKLKQKYRKWNGKSDEKRVVRKSRKYGFKRNLFL